MAIGAPSHTHGPSFTRKPQPMNNNSPRAFLTEAVVAASGPEGVAGGAGGKGREAARCSCADDREDGCGRPCALQRQVPAVLRVRSESASDSVRLQRVGLQLRRREWCAQCKLHGQVPSLGSLPCTSSCTTGAGERSVQAALVAFSGGEKREGAAGGFVCFQTAHHIGDEPI